MSYDENDAARDDFYEQLSRELYPDHKQQAIGEFTADRLRSYYVKNPNIMRPAIDTLAEANILLTLERYSPAVVFSASGIELLLKATLLRPVVYGLVHNDALAEIIVQRVIGRQTDIGRYEGLLAGLFHTLATIDLGAIRRDGVTMPLLQEAKKFQSLRDIALHQGAHCSPEDAKTAIAVAIAVYEKIVAPMLFALGLKVEEKGVIEPV